MIPQIQQVVQKLEQLSPVRLAEVVDFIDFIRQKEQDSNLSQTYAKASENSFAKVWDNEEDAVYDNL
ncbi:MULTISPECIES: toxin-antitoxin system antitoxin component Xre family [Leptospira]|uniref:toxin-antitoxin system antitoxin component Xre family n=1 Tax=Leptospira TaxID=171 RepID=UPI000292842A|nr:MULTISPECIES: toxin-antitoxin system antitoxin component Xre family [Leptospira]EKO78274.1 putative toxin-antitoxin system, antitoxin component, Xre family [Leptospira sp. Fiocruz LV3954]EMI60370.1 putative toxin-antitoxin system, antitoxin component, Xre family [Leptospira sp. Fiocruz LV4135]MDI7219519.1 toxin-antitoxin system, antitoxin component, Xre family protein [Leptospira santarosai]MDI7226538.1 toxin-antitoxin system, antitoxin component, Xre family protein [Leptospira santarosai]M